MLAKDHDTHERAITYYLRALAARPNFSQPLNNLGILYTLQGRAAAALEALQVR